MKQITSAEFKQAVNIDPAWASTITKPIEITDYCDMPNSKITHLSPLLTFNGKNNDGDSANFSGCKNLKIATGNFKGYSSFSYSGIEKIENLNCGVDKNGNSTFFSGCKNLRIATGNYEGAVDFSESGIEKIENLNCNKNISTHSSHFGKCENLKMQNLTNQVIQQAVDQNWIGIDFNIELKKRLTLAKIQESAVEIEF